MKINLRKKEHYIDYVGGDFVIPGGYSTIIEKMAKNIDIRLEDSVKKIEHNSNGVQVVTNKGNVFHSDKVIVTVPIGYSIQIKRFAYTEVFYKKIKLNLFQSCQNVK